MRESPRLVSTIGRLPSFRSGRGIGFMFVTVAVCGSLLIGCGGSGAHTSAENAPSVTSVAPGLERARRAAAIAACYPPQRGYGFERGSCSTVERLERVRAGVWQVQLRRPPVYCIRMHLGFYGGDRNLDVDEVGELAEVRCPPGAYSREAAADLEIPLRSTGPSGRRVGRVSLAAVTPTRTRVLVEDGADWAWISRGRCPRGTQHRFDLQNFHSFRSETILPVPLRSLLATPHSVLTDGGGAHGGDPLACADLAPP